MPSNAIIAKFLYIMVSNWASIDFYKKKLWMITIIADIYFKVNNYGKIHKRFLKDGT